MFHASNLALARDKKGAAPTMAILFSPSSSNLHSRLDTQYHHCYFKSPLVEQLYKMASKETRQPRFLKRATQSETRADAHRARQGRTLEMEQSFKAPDDTEFELNSTLDC